MADPDFIAGLTAAMRPDWTCGALWPERCEGTVTHYVHLLCFPRNHRRQHAICAGHLQKVWNGKALDMLAHPDLPRTCFGVQQVQQLIPIENACMSDPGFLTLKPSTGGAERTASDRRPERKT